MWFQGISEAPHIVQKCLRSWQDKNPSWEFITLDEKSVLEFVDFERILKENRRLVSKQALSDIIRINLLKKYGGVWVDATCLCLRPLDDWVYSYLKEGFFAFDRPGVDRPIASWFLASTNDCSLTHQYCDEVNRYWTAHRFSNQNNAVGQLIRSKIQRRMQNLPYDSKKFKFLFNLTKWGRFFPYYWFHYLFSQVLDTDKTCEETWNKTPKLSADIPHRAQRIGLSKLMDDLTKEQIALSSAPLYKLTWRYDETGHAGRTVLNYILNELN